ncbi:hypothetical protein AKJ41_02655 [candidate division MSBL1 archaeon SCGC-AAA259O05]|uniref:Probable thymidylate kinase n=1 Tax=candidate division MSBL1 archaeon SCGC-AAA259O05 TaxID=1698271 RepID=A0A133V3W5_9EURY|nr:hypothetical protein AKJ41_02655 [candidate division MSBL1 archaeon SCGC-AAA259O05]
MEDEFEGKFIALEGPDGCGKSTQAKLLSEWLESEGYDVKVTREPTENPTGKVLRDALREKKDLPIEAEALLFACDRLVHVSNVIKPNLEVGKIIVTERYVHSSLAYQTARGLSRDWVEEINKFAIEPDFTIFIDVPPQVGFKRVGSSGEADTFEQDLELQKRVREIYKDLAEEGNIPQIDGTKSPKEVHERVKDEIDRFLHA